MGYRSERRPCGVVYSFSEGIGVLISIFAFGKGGVRRGAVEERMDFERSFVSFHLMDLGCDLVPITEGVNSTEAVEDDSEGVLCPT